MPLSYNDVRKLILQTLEERPEGTKVEVPNQQNYELALLDYVQQLETTMSTSMVGIADAETEPIEPPSARVAYLSQVGVKSTVTYKNFVDAQLNPLVVTTDESHVAFVTLFWNTNYWQLQAVMIPVIAGSSGTMDYNELENLPSINGVTIKGDLTAEMLGLVSSEIFDQYKKATDQRLDVIEEALFGSKAALQVAAVPPSITAGVLTDVTISWSTKFDGEEVTPDSLTVKRGDTVLTTDVALKSVVDHISETAQYTVTAVIKGVAKSAEIAVEANAKMYYGADVSAIAYQANGAAATSGADIAGDPGATKKFAFVLTLDAAENTTISERTQQITATTKGTKSATITLKQAAGDPYLEIDKTSVNVPQNGSGVTINVTTNTTFTVS